MAKLSPAQVRERIALIPPWKTARGRISRVFKFEDFVQSLKFVQAVGRLAEKHWHHPDIDIRWNTVTLSLTTHDEGGLTEKDFEMAERIEKLPAAKPAGS